VYRVSFPSADSSAFCHPSCIDTLGYSPFLSRVKDVSLSRVISLITFDLPTFPNMLDAFPFFFKENGLSFPPSDNPIL